LFGRSEECQLVLTDDSISRYHGSLVRTPAGIWVVDLLSREGVWVNGLRVKWAWLAEGDALRIGRFTFVVRYPTVPDRVRRIDVPLEAGAYRPARAGIAANDTRMLPVKFERRLPVRSNYPTRSRISYPAHPHVEASPVSVSPDEDEWGRVADFGPAPAAVWHQHRQFLEMFHSEMVLMVQMFMTMHRDHVSVIREELARIEELSSELANLQAEVDLGSSLATRDQQPEGAGRSSETAARSAIETARQYRSPDPARPNRDRNRQRRTRADAGAKSPPEKSLAPPAAGAEQHDAIRPPAVDTVAFHAQITRRIAELQRERQGYWRKILNLMAVSAD
jgi:hypothetical protein